jgi:hypothetical protein
VPLSDLGVTKLGGPYPLLHAGHRRLPKFWPWLRGKVRAGLEATEGFTFSQRTCAFPDDGEPPSQRTCASPDGAERSMRQYPSERMTLEEAVAISGAAFNPLQARNPLVLVLMTLLNLRLGQWLPIRQARRRLGDGFLQRFLSRPTWFALLLDYFFLGREWHFAFLTDGGIYENLGVEPLLNRECSIIVAADATQDGQYGFDDFLRVLRRARVRFGIRIVRAVGDTEQPLRLTAVQPRRRAGRRARAALALRNRPLSARHWLLARIVYPSGRQGFLVCIKPTLNGDEGADLLGHAAQNAQFPHDPTLDQMYDERQFESYRQLGYHIAEKFCRVLLRRAGGADEQAMWAKDFNLEEAIRRRRRRPSRTGPRSYQRTDTARAAPASEQKDPTG